MPSQLTVTTTTTEPRREPWCVPRLHLVTDTRGGRDPLPEVRAALAATGPGDLAVQVRAKQVTDRELLDLTRRVLALAAPSGTPVVVDDRVDIALAAGARAVHLGAHDLPVADAVRLAGEALAVGGTARAPETALAAQSAGASYLGVGPAFHTTTKDGLPDPLGPEGISAVAAVTALPVIAIGGVTAERVAELVRAGAHGVAVVAAISAAADPYAATIDLLRALESSR